MFAMSVPRGVEAANDAAPSASSARACASILMPVPDDDPRRRPRGVADYRATVDVPARFRKSKSVGAVFGLTCSKYQSGEIDWSGRISRRGDEMMRQRSQEIARDALSSDAAHTRKASAAVVLLRSQKKPDDFFRTAVADLNDLR
jgi:hypothetical protein